DLHADQVAGFVDIVELVVRGRAALPPGILSKILINLINEIGFTQLRLFINIFGKLRRAIQLRLVYVRMEVLAALEDTARFRAFSAFIMRWHLREDPWRHGEFFLAYPCYASAADDGVQEVTGLKIHYEVIYLAQL